MGVECPCSLPRPWPPPGQLAGHLLDESRHAAHARLLARRILLALVLGGVHRCNLAQHRGRLRGIEGGGGRQDVAIPALENPAMASRLQARPSRRLAGHKCAVGMTETLRYAQARPCSLPLGPHQASVVPLLDGVAQRARHQHRRVVILGQQVHQRGCGAQGGNA